MNFLSPSVVQESLPDPRWARNKKGFYHRLLSLDPEANGLARTSGVYVVWHAGVRPQWLFVGRSNDLARTFHDIADDEEIMGYNVHGGIHVTWAPVREEFQAGVVRYLSDALKPKIANPDSSFKSAKPVSVLPPRPKSASK